MKISKRTTLTSVLLVPLLAAIAVRTVLYIFWLESPVRFYSSVSGLDMQTTLIIGSWLYQGFSIFTIHKFMIAAVMFFNKGQQCPEALVLIQMILGAAAAPLIAWSALHLTGKRIWAMLAGLAAAMYAPALLYESITLRESTQTFFAALSLFGLLWARKRHFDITGMIVAGVCLSLPCLNRISSVPFLLLGILWIALYLFLKNKKKQHPYKQLLTKMSVMVLALAVVFGPVSLFNSKRSSFSLPFHIDLNYALKLGKIEKPKDMNVGPLQVAAPEAKPQKPVQATVEAAANTEQQEHYGIPRYLRNCINKFYLLFKPFEIANNVNYYFMKYKLFPLQYMAGPLLVIPLAFTAILFMLCSWQWMRKEGLLVLYILSYSMPLVFFYPLARYRLIMYPVFCILMFYPFYKAYSQVKHRNTALLILPMLLLYISVFIVTMPEEISIRPTDYITYGKAMQYQAGKATNESGEYFKYAIEQYPDYIPGYVNYADNLIKTGQYQQANALLTNAYARFNSDNGIAYYYGISLLGTRNPAKAESIFRKIPAPDSNDARSQYYYCLGEALRLQNKIPEALESYKAGLEFADAKRKEILLKVIAGIEKKLQQSPQTLLR
ncbi:MAG: tetratricopeptide repeat protein [Victivallaceae bacterium]